MGKFFPKATAIYLDQFAVSALCDDYQAKTEPWTAIGALLKRGVDSGKIICPYSLEHLMETSMKHEQNAITQDINFADLARNTMLRNELDSTARYVMAIVRNKQPDYHTYFQSFKGTTLNNDWKRMRFQEQRNLLQEMTTDMFGVANVVRGANRIQPPPEMRSFVFSQIRQQYENDLLERFFQLGTFGFFKTKTVTIAGNSIPFWADQLLNKLVTEYKFNQQDALRGKHIVIEQGLVAFPSMYIRATLEASMACNSKKETVNDQIDTIRIAGALHAVDIMLTDGGKANDIRDAKLDKKFSTEVYSGKRGDLNNFKNKLQSLL